MARRLSCASLWIAAVAGLSATSAQTIAVTNGRVVIGDGSDPIEGGTLLVRDGRVVAVGRGIVVPADARVIDAAGKWVTPGLFAGFTRLGLVEVDAVNETNERAAAASPFNAAIDVALGLNPRAAAIAINRSDGVTRAVVAPEMGSSLFAGQGAVIDTGSDMEPVTRARAFQFVELGEAGAAKAGGSRPAAHAQFRDALLQARDFARNPAAFDGRSKDALLTRADAAALVPVVEGRMPLLVHVERASDILRTLDLKRAFPALRLVLVGATEAWTVADEVAAAKVPVIASALADLPYSFESLAATQSNIGRLRAAGVTVAIGMINDDDTRQARLVKQYAGNLVALGRIPGAAGLDWGAAFATISSLPAKIMGMGQELGMLRPGYRADVVLWDGDPLELASAPVSVLIDGVEQPIGNRQRRLRDRYRSPQEGQLPKAYER